MSVVVSYKRQSVVFVVMAVIALAATEIAVRYAGDPALDAYVCTSFMDSILYSGVAHRDRVNMCREYVGVQYDRSDARMRVPLPFDGTHVNINGDGFRGPPLDAFGGDPYTIYMLGGSTTYGLTTVSDDRTIPAQLERKLRGGGIDARVINAGVPGASTNEERYRLERDIAHRDPDMVIMYDGVNEWITPGLSYDEFLATDEWVEVAGLIFPLRGAGGSANGTAAEGADGPPNPPPPRERTTRWSLGLGIGVISLVNAVDYRTGIGVINFLKDMVPVEVEADEDAPERARVDYGPAVERKLRDNWGGVCEAGDRMGFVTVNFLQPHIGTSNRTVSAHERGIDSDILVGLDPPLYVRASDLLATVDLDPAGYPPCRHVHDLRGVFDGMDGVPIYFDWSHMSGSGNDVVASAMYEIVRPLVADDITA